MNENYDLRKYGADKIVLLGLFLISLLIAQLIVSVNSAIQFTGPIELSHAGLSLSIPAGKGWQSTGKWRYEDNAFVLSSNFMEENGVPAAIVNCKCFMASQRDLDSLPFKEPADDSNNAKIEIEKIQKGSLTIYKTHIDKPFIVYMGAAELPNNRTVSIEVFQTTFEIDVADRVFKKIIDSLEYRQDNPFKTGSDMVSEIQKKGIDSFLDKENRQVCFFIQDSNNRNAGFTFDLLDYMQSGGRSWIKGASRLHMSGYNFQEQVSLFQCDNDLGRYVWESQTLGRTGRTDTKLTFDKSGTVTKQVNNSYGEYKYPAGTKIVPTIYIELLISMVVQGKVEKVAIEMINSDGKILPILLTLKSSDDKTDIVSLAFLDRAGLSETFYLNKNGRIIKADIEGPSGYYLERTDIESIEAKFQVQSGYILKQYEALDNNRL